MKKGFIVHHNGPPANCLDRSHTRCVAFWNAVKAYHQAKWPNSNDIAYSFGVCPHGTRFVGRGWDRNQYAGGTDVVGHDDGPDSAWYSVLAFVGGGYTEPDGTKVPEEKPTEAMVAGIANLIGEGRNQSHCGTRVLPHSAFKPKPCPGPTLTQLAIDWDSKPLAAPATPSPPPPEEPDMRIIDCPGAPALLVYGDGRHENINGAQRDALRSAGYPAGLVTKEERATILALLDG